MAKRIISVGVDFPGDVEIEDEVSYGSRRSLLDADIVLFSPDTAQFRQNCESYQGKPSLYESSSFELREASSHWRREISAAVGSGKTVFVFTKEHPPVFVDTGERTYSGTGRSRRTTRLVASMTRTVTCQPFWHRNSQRWNAYKARQRRAGFVELLGRVRQVHELRGLFRGDERNSASNNATR